MTIRKRAALAFLFLLVNAGYLWAFPAPDLFYVGMVFLHFAVGAGLLAVFWMSKDELIRDLRCGSKPAFFLLSTCGALGLVLLFVGATSETRYVTWAHLGAGYLGALAALPWVSRRAPRLKSALAATLAVAAALPAVAWLQSRNPTLIGNPVAAPLSMDEEGEGRGSPFFPSSATTSTGDIIPSGFFLDSKQCAECHQDIYDQWNSSAHHFGSFNNQFYRKSIEYMQDTAGVQASKWCAGCHDHAVFFNGRFDTPIKEQIDTPEAQAGLGCMSCHSIVHVGDTMGNGGFVIDYPPLHDLASSQNPVIAPLNKWLTETAPAAHREAFMKPFMKTSEFCAPCHKVHLDVPVNDYRWLRGFNEYDAWQASGVSGQGARSFYYPAQSQGCADCHMPLVESDDPGGHDGFVRSHRFPAANTAVPHVNHDEEQLKVVEDFLQAGIVSVDIFAASPVDESTAAPEMKRRSDGPEMSTSFGVGEEESSVGGPVILRQVGEIAAPLDRAQPVFRAGDAVKVDVVVRTRKVGHLFPGGTVDSVDCWIELRAKDARGRDLFWSGRVEDDGAGPVEPGAHFYRSVMLDEHGNHVNKRNAFQTRSLLYAKLIPPGAADVAHYRIDIPEWAEGPVRLEAAVHYRKFSHYYTQFSYAGQPVASPEGSWAKGYDDREYSFAKENIPANVSGQIKDRIPTLPITTLAKAEATIELGAEETQWEPALIAEDYLRWNDYGIGLLLQGDLNGAQFAFKRVTELKPDYADGWLNIGRALVVEGQTEAARPYVDKALEIAPEIARAHFFKGLILKAAGELDEALVSLETAAASYPRDRVVLNEIARVLFLQRRYEEAIGVLDRVSGIDPEDLQMHYTRMLCFRGLGDLEAADREEALFRRFKADESSQTRTARIRRSSPEDNNERQPIHEHVSAPLAHMGDTEGSVAGGDDD